MKLKWDNDWVAKQVVITFESEREQDIFLTWMRNRAGPDLDDYEQELVEAAETQLAIAYKDARHLGVSCESLNCLLSIAESEVLEESSQE